MKTELKMNNNQTAQITSGEHQGGHISHVSSTEVPSLAAQWWQGVPDAQHREGIFFPENMGSMPCVKNKKGSFVPLFHVFAVMEEKTDFVAVCRELPDLYPAAISNVSNFIYGALQANTTGIRIEPLIEQYGHGRTLFSTIERMVGEAAPSVAEGDLRLSVTSVRMTLLEVSSTGEFPGGHSFQSTETGD